MRLDQLPVRLYVDDRVRQLAAAFTKSVNVRLPLSTWQDRAFV